MPETIKAEVVAPEKTHAFDARPYFEQAEEQALMELAQEDFAGGYPAALVAAYCAELDEDLKDFLDELTAGGTVQGTVSCRVDAQDALRWIETQRPELAARIARRPEVDAAIARRLAALDNQYDVQP